MEYDAGDQSQVDRKKSKAKLERDRRQDAIRYVIGDYKGREFLWNLLSECGIYGVSLSSTPEQTAFNEGKRKVALDLLVDISVVDPHIYSKIRDEAVERETRKK